MDASSADNAITKGRQEYLQGSYCITFTDLMPINAPVSTTCGCGEKGP